MEASEKLEITDQPGSVRVIGDRIVVERLEVADERTARVIRERAEVDQPPARTVVRAIEIGARVLDSEETAANVDYVRAELERGVGQINEELSTTLEAGNEALAERIAVAFGADRSDSVQQQIKQMVAQANEEQRLAIARLFSSDDGANPLSEFKSTIVRNLNELDERRQRDREADRKRIEELMEELVVVREKLGGKEELDEEVARGTAKGRTFEDAVFAAIERIADARGDSATHVGDDPGAGGSKKGDALVEIGAADGPATGRIVFEVKDSRLTKPKAWAELNGALEARSAAFAVLVVAGEQSVPPGPHELQEYEGNKMIVAVDPERHDDRSLELAYRYARCRTLLARENELSMDAAGVRDAAAAAPGGPADARGDRP